MSCCATHCENIFESAKKGCEECLTNFYSKNVNDIDSQNQTANDIALENGNISYVEKLLEICFQTSDLNAPKNLSTQQSLPSTNVSAIIQKEIISSVTKCIHGHTEGHQIMKWCAIGRAENCCGNGRCGGGFHERCWGKGYIVVKCPHNYSDPHSFVAGFCKGPVLN